MRVKIYEDLQLVAQNWCCVMNWSYDAENESPVSDALRGFRQWTCAFQAPADFSWRMNWKAAAHREPGRRVRLPKKTGTRGISFLRRFNTTTRNSVLLGGRRKFLPGLADPLGCLIDWSKQKKLPFRCLQRHACLQEWKIRNVSSRKWGRAIFNSFFTYFPKSNASGIVPGKQNEQNKDFWDGRVEGQIYGNKK